MNITGCPLALTLIISMSLPVQCSRISGNESFSDGDISDDLENMKLTLVRVRPFVPSLKNLPSLISNSVVRKSDNKASDSPPSSPTQGEGVHPPSRVNSYLFPRAVKAKSNSVSALESYNSHNRRSASGRAGLPRSYSCENLFKEYGEEAEVPEDAPTYSGHSIDSDDDNQNVEILCQSCTFSDSDEIELFPHSARAREGGAQEEMSSMIRFLNETCPGATTLQFINMGLQSLPSEITSLTSLTELDLSGNNLTSLPSQLSQMKTLKLINISQNKFQDLPTVIGEMDLEELDISGNPYKTVPEDMFLLMNNPDSPLHRNLSLKLAYANTAFIKFHEHNLKVLKE